MLYIVITSWFKFLGFNNRLLTVYENYIERANKKLSNVGIWERSKQASIEAQQRKYEVIS